MIFVKRIIIHTIAEIVPMQNHWPVEITGYRVMKKHIFPIKVRAVLIFSPRRLVKEAPSVSSGFDFLFPFSNSLFFRINIFR